MRSSDEVEILDDKNEDDGRNNIDDHYDKEEGDYEWDN